MPRVLAPTVERGLYLLMLKCVPSCHIVWGEGECPMCSGSGRITEAGNQGCLAGPNPLHGGAGNCPGSCLGMDH